MDRAERIRHDLRLLQSMERHRAEMARAVTVKEFTRPRSEVVEYVCQFGAGASQLYADGTVEFRPFVLDEPDETP